MQPEGAERRPECNVVIYPNSEAWIPNSLHKSPESRWNIPVVARHPEAASTHSNFYVIPHNSGTSIMGPEFFSLK